MAGARGVRSSYGSQSSLGSVGRIFPPESTFPYSGAIISSIRVRDTTSLSSRQDSVAVEAASEPELDQETLQESGMDDQEFDAYILSLPSQARQVRAAFTADTTRTLRMGWSFMKRESSPEDGGKDVGR